MRRAAPLNIETNGLAGLENTVISRLVRRPPEVVDAPRRLHRLLGNRRGLVVDRRARRCCDCCRLTRRLPITARVVIDACRGIAPHALQLVHAPQLRLADRARLQLVPRLWAARVPRLWRHGLRIAPLVDRNAHLVLEAPRPPLLHRRQGLRVLVRQLLERPVDGGLHPAGRRAHLLGESRPIEAQGFGTVNGAHHRGGGGEGVAGRGRHHGLCVADLPGALLLARPALAPLGLVRGPAPPSLARVEVDAIRVSLAGHLHLGRRPSRRPFPVGEERHLQVAVVRLDDGPLPALD
mmetsp:Transcript_13634/g.26940  ORF Transcript_13634/g.26940 Transcript_13634/m.26940 type:complete len:294 (-) Transcript_13634:777-1658(-)